MKFKYQHITLLNVFFKEINKTLKYRQMEDHIITKVYNTHLKFNNKYQLNKKKLIKTIVLVVNKEYIKFNQFSD